AGADIADDSDDGPSHGRAGQRRTVVGENRPPERISPGEALPGHRLVDDYHAVVPREIGGREEAAQLEGDTRGPEIVRRADIVVRVEARVLVSRPAGDAKEPVGAMRREGR